MAPKPRSGSSRRSASAARRNQRQDDSEARTLARPDHRPSSRPPAQSFRPRRARASPSPATRRRRWHPGPDPAEDLVQAVRQECFEAGGSSRADGDGEDAGMGQVELIYAMLQSGEDVNQHSSVGGFSPLAVAAAAGNDALVSLLLDKGADPSLASLERKQLPLHLAVAHGHPLVCQLLVGPTREAGVINAANSAGWTPLHLAASAGREDLVRILLGGGASVDARGFAQGGLSAAHLAAKSGHVTALEELLDRDADPNAFDDLGSTPLHLASACCGDDCVALLLRHRADPNLRGGLEGVTCLELVPLDESASRTRILRLLSAYERGNVRRRTDARFDLGVAALAPREGILPSAVRKLDDCAEVLL